MTSPSSFAELSRRYSGEAARRYDALRAGKAKWAREQAAVDIYVAEIPVGATVLDIPVGTGRFFATYARRGLRTTGMDISADMLAQARLAADQLGLDVRLREGDIRSIDSPDSAFDVGVCIRFLNWVDAAGLEVCLTELSRVVRSHLIIGVRYYADLPELGLTPLGLARWTGQQVARRASLPGFRWEPIIHEKRDVTRLIAANRWAIARRSCIDRRRDGSNYVIYLLRR